jgi:hypothetical protein
MAAVLTSRVRQATAGQRAPYAGAQHRSACRAIAFSVPPPPTARQGAAPTILAPAQPPIPALGNADPLLTLVAFHTAAPAAALDRFATPALVVAGSQAPETCSRTEDSRQAWESPAGRRTRTESTTSSPGTRRIQMAASALGRFGTSNPVRPPIANPEDAW